MAIFLCLAWVVLLLLALLVVVMFFVSFLVVMWLLVLTSESMGAVDSFERWAFGAASKEYRASRAPLSKSSASDRD